MSAFDERRHEDVRKVRDLEQTFPGKLRVTKVTGTPPETVELELGFRTAGSARYPADVQSKTKVRITLTARYPFEAPTVNLSPAVFHPNVWSSGQVCLGVKWLPTFGLDQLVKRLVQIITFDPTVLNLSSPANGDATTWYSRTLKAHPGAFPSDTMSAAPLDAKKSMTWTDTTPPATKAVVDCPNCNAHVGLPSGKNGRVICPKCKQPFEAST